MQPPPAVTGSEGGSALRKGDYMTFQLFTELKFKVWLFQYMVLPLLQIPTSRKTLFTHVTKYNNRTESEALVPVFKGTGSVKQQASHKSVTQILSLAF